MNMQDTYGVFINNKAVANVHELRTILNIKLFTEKSLFV